MLTLFGRDAPRQVRACPIVITDRIELSPAQRSAADRVLAAIHSASVVVLKSTPGTGRTTVLRHVQSVAGGMLIGAREFMNALAAHQPAAIEESFLSLLDNALDNHDLVIVDDLHLLTSVVNSCDYPRTRLLDVALAAILDRAAARHNRLLFAMDHDTLPVPVDSRAFTVEIATFRPADYETICAAYLGASAQRLDYNEIYRFAPELTAHQLANACSWLKLEHSLDTACFTEFLATQNMTSNVELEQVAPVDWKDLKGFDDVIQALEAKVALPFENRRLAAELQLKPKRGVLLVGPPGTGKTTIGRALAARLKGKFFLIDGTVIAGTDSFFMRVRRIFDAAKHNAPSVVFIDDADLIFENFDGRGFCRYLLTMLDGLESASAERVCVIITAMDVSSLPAAVLRSGRIELWLETRLPDTGARTAILTERLSRLPHPLGSVDVDLIAEASARLTGADLRAVVEDGKLLYAHDKAMGKPPRAVEEYFLDAIQTVRGNQQSYVKRRPAQFPARGRYGFIAE